MKPIPEINYPKKYAKVISTPVESLQELTPVRFECSSCGGDLTGMIKHVLCPHCDAILDWGETKAGDIDRDELMALLSKLRGVVDDLRGSAEFTNRAVQNITAKLHGFYDAEQPWDEFMDQMYVQCMNSKNALRYTSIVEQECDIWRKLLDLAGTVKENEDV